MVVIIEDLQANEAEPLSMGVCGPNEAGGFRVTVGIGSQAGEAFQGVGGSEMCIRSVGDRE